MDKHGEGLREGEGTCRMFEECPPGKVFWPLDGECYQHHTRGPCLNGYLIYVNPNTGKWGRKKVYYGCMCTECSRMGHSEA